MIAVIAAQARNDILFPAFHRFLRPIRIRNKGTAYTHRIAPVFSDDFLRQLNGVDAAARNCDQLRCFFFHPLGEFDGEVFLLEDRPAVEHVFIPQVRRVHPRGDDHHIENSLRPFEKFDHFIFGMRQISTALIIQLAGNRNRHRHILTDRLAYRL